jgi:hypothetical protein
MITLLKHLCCLLFFVPVILNAQCLIPPAFPGCSPPGSIPLVSGASVSAGQIHTFSGTNTFTSVTLNGGTMIVCGNLTLNSMTVNSGNIYVQSGASLTVFNGGAAIPFGANTNIYNYGTTIFRVSIVTNTNNTLFNCLPTSSFTIPFDQLVLQGPGTYLVNNGTMQTSFFIVQPSNSPNCVCLGSGSTITTNTIINQFTNAFNVPVGNACLNVIQNVINPNIVTNTSSLFVCVPTGVNTITGPNWGSATLFTNCTGCSGPLPVELLYFNGYTENRNNILEWATTSENNNCHFILERSFDCVHFENVAYIPGAIYSNDLINYTRTDENIVDNRVYYYRLNQFDCDGSHHYSDMISLYTSEVSNLSWDVWPNPANDFVHISNHYYIKQVSLFNTLGQEMSCTLNEDRLKLEHLTAGTYYLQIVPVYGDPVVKKLVKK